jgi:HK97 gp10 family phage protein
MGFEIKNDNTDKILGQLQPAEETALEAVGLAASGDMRLAVTVMTGYLRNSLTYALGGKGAEMNAFRADKPGTDGQIREGSYSGTAEKRSVPTVFVGTNVEYGAYVELGTELTKGKPYMKPTIMKNKRRYQEIFNDQFKNGMDV